MIYLPASQAIHCTVAWLLTCLGSYKANLFRSMELEWLAWLNDIYIITQMMLQASTLTCNKPY